MKKLGELQGCGVKRSDAIINYGTTSDIITLLR
jgi:hypothetical protein